MKRRDQCEPDNKGEQTMIQSRTPPVVDDTDYPASDGQPVGETPRHVNNLFYVSYPLSVWFVDDPQVFVAANMFVYYERGNNRRHVSPDVFVSLGIPKETVPPRERYLLWEEGKGPDTVIEFTSPSTADEDLNHKRTIYRDVLRVREYFLFDPTGETLDPPLQGQRLVNGDYQPIQPVNGRLPSEALRLHLEVDGDLLRLWNPLTRQWLPIPPDFPQMIQAAEAARQQTAAEYVAEQEARRQAEAARRQAEAALKQAEDTRRQEEQARRQAETALATERAVKEQAEALRVQEERARKQAEEGLRQKQEELERLRREIEALRRGDQKEP
jgi:Uma2 family endonuclease